MKSLKLSFSAFLILLMVTSCGINLRETKMTKNYQEAMNSSETIKAIDSKTGNKVNKSLRQIAETNNVYFKPSDIKNEYEVIAVYRPFVLSVPIIAPYSRRLTKKLLQKSMKKCAELGGNAILVQSYDCCLIIKEK